MGKLFVHSTVHTPADCIRDALDKAERLVSNLRGCGSQVLKLLHLLDQAAEAIAELDVSGVDVRAESARFETVQRQLCRRQNRFLTEAGAALQEERAAVQPDRTRWWWFLDEEAARQRRYQLRRAATWSLVTVFLCVVAWLVYDRFIAPPPQVRQAFQHSTTGETLVSEGDLRAALAEFEAAAALNPDDPGPWLWQGIVHFELDELDEAELAFETARSRYERDLDFLLDRGMAYLRTGDLVAASADVEQIILETPDAGHAYYLRAGIATERGDYAAAVADLERAAELAHAAGDTRLEATARTQRAMVMQLQLYQQVTPLPQTEG